MNGIENGRIPTMQEMTTALDRSTSEVETVLSRFSRERSREQGRLSAAITEWPDRKEELTSGSDAKMLSAMRSAIAELSAMDQTARRFYRIVDASGPDDSLTPEELHVAANAVVLAERDAEVFSSPSELAARLERELARDNRAMLAAWLRVGRLELKAGERRSAATDGAGFPDVEGRDRVKSLLGQVQDRLAGEGPARLKAKVYEVQNRIDEARRAIDPDSRASGTHPFRSGATVPWPQR